MKGLLPITLSMIFLVASLHAFSDEDLERLDSSMFDNPRRPGAVFFHDDHNETAEIEECSLCHHVYENGMLSPDESSEDSPCSECHMQKPGPENKISLEVAFHKRCKTCHFSSRKGPVLCGECHINNRGES